MATTKNARPEAKRPQAVQRATKQARPKPGEVNPVFDSMFQPDDDAPALADYPGVSVEDDANFEISETLQRILDEKKARREQYRVMTDPNFYLVVCFQSSVQRDEFIEKAGWQDLGAPYADGLELARLLGIDLQPVFLPRKQVRSAPKALRSAIAPRT